MKRKQITINRAPVLTLWATVVAERLGYNRKTALTLGKAVAGLNAQSKGRRLGIFSKAKVRPIKIVRKSEQQKNEKETVILLNRPISVARIPEGARALIKGKCVDPKEVQSYLVLKFGDDLSKARAAMEDLARSFTTKELAVNAYAFYEKFRPTVPEGEQGWGAKGVLDLKILGQIAKGAKG